MREESTRSSLKEEPEGDGIDHCSGEDSQGMRAQEHVDHGERTTQSLEMRGVVMRETSKGARRIDKKI